MAVQHSAIPDAQLHEPKGAATASSGDIYIADGLGSGAWTPFSRYGELYITSGATTQALTTTAARLDPGTEWTLNIASGITTTAADGTFTINTAGVYQVSCYLSFNTDSVAAGTLYTLYYAVNGVLNAKSVSVQKLTAGVDRLDITALGLGSFALNDVISLYMKSSVNSTITMVEAGFTLMRP